MPGIRHYVRRDIMLSQFLVGVCTCVYGTSPFLLVLRRTSVCRMPYANSPACLPACLPACQFDMATPRANLGRDDRLRILTLRDTGLSYAAIANRLNLSHRQVQYICHSQQATPKKPKSQPPKLSEEQMDDIIAFISASEINRQRHTMR